MSHGGGGARSPRRSQACQDGYAVGLNTALDDAGEQQEGQAARGERRHDGARGRRAQSCCSGPAPTRRRRDDVAQRRRVQLMNSEGRPVALATPGSSSPCAPRSRGLGANVSARFVEVRGAGLRLARVAVQVGSHIGSRGGRRCSITM